MVHIKKLNEFNNLDNNSDELMDKNRTIVDHRLRGIDVKNKLKEKLAELSQIIDEL
jgi:hypothetical protein